MDKPIDRETFLDVIKGMAMLLVVMQHVGGRLNEGLVFLCKIDVPLFFVVSGYLALKSNIKVWQALGKKTKRIVVPFVLSLFLASLCYEQSIQNIIVDIGKYGYWFLLCLFLFFVLFYALHKIGHGKILLAGSCVIELILLMLSKFAPEMIDNIIGISYMARYFPCFMAGVLIKLYGVKHINRTVGSLLLVITCVAFTYKGANTNISFLLNVIGYVCSSIFVFYFIKCIESETPNFIKVILECIGKKSLAIYIIHFYFVTHLTQSTGYFAIDLAIVLCLSLIIIVLSIAVEKIFTKMTHLNKVI